MTLLSIREQEAVQQALDRLKQAHVQMLRGDCGVDEGRRRLVVLRDAEREYATTVILATRDAIARQVRERAEGYKVLTPFTVAHDLATFIEDLPCE